MEKENSTNPISTPLSPTRSYIKNASARAKLIRVHTFILEPVLISVLLKEKQNSNVNKQRKHTHTHTQKEMPLYPQMLLRPCC